MFYLSSVLNTSLAMTIPAKAGIKAPDNITYIYPHNKPVRGVIKVTRRGNLGHSYGRMRSGINKEGNEMLSRRP